MATPASLRIGIGVVPAWFWMPLKVRRYGVDADDRGDDADALAGVLQQAALLDMGFEVAAIPPLLQLDARRLVETGGLQRIAHRAAVVAMAGGVDVGLGRCGR